MRKLLMAAAVAVGTLAGVGGVEAAPVAMPLPAASAAPLAAASAGGVEVGEARVQTVQYRRHHRRHHRRHYRHHGRYYR